MLTGKDVYEACYAVLNTRGLVAVSWDSEHFPPEAKVLYEEAAQKLNEAHIAPLQGDIETQRITITALMDSIVVLQQQIAPLQELVKDYMEFSKYATPLLKRGRLEWEAESEALAQRAQALLAEAKEQ